MADFHAMSAIECTYERLVCSVCQVDCEKAILIFWSQDAWDDPVPRICEDCLQKMLKQVQEHKIPTRLEKALEEYRRWKKFNQEERMREMAKHLKDKENE